MRDGFIELENGLPEALEGEASFSQVKPDSGVFVYDGDLASGEAFLLESIESTYDETQAYRVTPVEGIDSDMDDVTERLSALEGYEGEIDRKTLLMQSGPSKEIETDTLYQEDDDPQFHVREMVKTYRQDTGDIEYTPGKPPEGSWGERPLR